MSYTKVLVFLLMNVCLAFVSISQESQKRNLIEDLDRIVDKAAREDRFSGAIMITQNNKTIYEKAVGYSNRETKELNKIDTKFNVGSMNKMHTAVSILQLVKKGKISLDNKLIDVWPDYPIKEVAEKITIHQILTHSSGLGDYLMKIMRAPSDKYQEVSDYLPLIVNDPLKFEPGEKFSYSNSGFMLLGAVIEKVSGMSYFDYVKKNIYEPAGMKDTGFELYVNSTMENLAIPYTRWVPGAGGELQAHPHPGKGGPAGGGYSTVGDWIKFGQALTNYSLLDEKLYKILIDGKIGVNGSEKTLYAYGFMSDKLLGLNSIGHGGGGPGINGEFEFYSNGYAISILGNLDPHSASSIKRAFVSLLLQEENKLPKPSSKGNISFKLDGYEDAKVVSVMGSMNGSDPYANIMKKENGKWVCSMDLEPGEYTYRFVVDGHSILDPNNPNKKGEGPMRTFSSLKVD